MHWRKPLREREVVRGEPFGQVVIEAMMAGKPVFATEGGAIPQMALLVYPA